MFSTLIKHGVWGSCLILIHWAWSRACQFAFPTNSQVSLIRLVGDYLHLENHCANLFSTQLPEKSPKLRELLCFERHGYPLPLGESSNYLAWATTYLCSLILPCGLDDSCSWNCPYSPKTVLFPALSTELGTQHGSSGCWKVRADVCRGSRGRDQIFLLVTALTVPLHGPAAAITPTVLVSPPCCSGGASPLSFPSPSLFGSDFFTSVCGAS